MAPGSKSKYGVPASLSVPALPLGVKGGRRQRLGPLESLCPSKTLTDRTASFPSVCAWGARRPGQARSRGEP